MDYEYLKIERTDFTSIPEWKWWLRRGAIGVLLGMYYLYAIFFVMTFIEPKDVASITSVAAHEANHHLLMTTFGFLGSVFALSRTFVITQNRIDFSVAWYITRPLQGVLMALFLYYAFRAGQLAFFSGGGTEIDAKALNIYTLSILAVLSGLFAEHAYARLFVLAEKMLKIKPDKKE